MKGFRKGLACLLLLATLLAFTACKTVDGSLPAGMMIASCMGADYRLYVPTTWNLNTAYGISGAYRDANNHSVVSVVRYEIDESVSALLEGQDDRLGTFYYTKVLTPIRDQAFDHAIREYPDGNLATVLGGVNAHRFYSSAVINDETIHFVHVIAERAGGFYVLSFSALVNDNVNMYDRCIGDVETIIREFTFDEPYVPEDYSRTLSDDSNVPAGLKVAYSDDVAYRFYVPESWTVDLDQSIYAAVCPTDRSSISVIPYYPEEAQMSVAEYYTRSRELMIQTAGEDGFVEIRATNTTLGGRNATDYEYTYVIGGNVYHYRQVIAAYKSMIYCLTYTATETAYTSHLSEFDAVLSEFSFK